MSESIDQLQSFMINDAPVRGRVVRLGSVLDEVLGRHDYPYLVAHALAESLTVASILASNLKADGIFTIQIQSKGPVSLLVVDAVHGGDIRGYAEFDRDAIEALEAHDLEALFGEGFLAITLDQGEKAQRYQGVVPLEGDDVADAIQHYFTHSQQIDVKLNVVIGGQTGADKDHWMSGGMYIEKMPEQEGVEADADAWPRSVALYETVKDEELLDTQLPLDELLHRLFHEDGVWANEVQPITHHCRCSREKISGTLKGMGEAACEEMMVDNTITVTCQFCSENHVFDRVDVKHLLNS